MNKKIIILGLLTVSLTISIAIGFSYALWTQTEKQGTPNVVQSGCFSITLSGENDINIPNGYPISDDKGKDQAPYTFTINNTCSIYASYAVNLEKLSSSSMDGKYVKVMLDNNEPKLYSEYKSEATPTEGASESKTLVTGGLNPQGSITYELRLWIDYSGTNDTVGGKTFNSRIVISAAAAEQETYCTKNPSSPLCSDKNQLAFDDPDGNLRFIGQDPHNYVTFNDETAGWRIIGVFDMYECPEDTDSEKIDTGNYVDKCTQKTLLKLIRKDFLGDIAWDSSEANDWSNASLQKLLNEGDYWTRSNTYSSNGLTTTAQNMIALTMWNLGGTASYTSSSNGLASNWYTYERGNTVPSGRPTKWIGKVGLMYPSDYGYATGGGTSKNREACLNKELYNWHDSSFTDCRTNDWLDNSSYVQWTLTPISSDACYVFSVDYSGYVYDYDLANYANGVRPVVYLKSNVNIIHDKDHDGSSEKPYGLSLE